MGTPDFRKMSAKEFIQWEAEQDERYEYVDGEVFAMTGGTYGHDRTRINLTAALFTHLRNTPCKVLGPEMKLRVDSETPGYYPDLFVACSPIDQNTSELGEAKLIVEVLSPSTEKKDRGAKWIDYQKLNMLQEYVLIDPAKQRVELFRRESQSDWRLHVCNASEPVRFETLAFEISFEALFEDLR